MGGGPAGAALAWQLSRQGIPLTLVEASRSFERAFRGCTSELLTVQQELVDYLLAKKHKLLGLDAAAPESDRNYNSFT